MSKWYAGEFCVGCKDEINQWEYIMADCCPHCGHCDNFGAVTTKRVYQLIIVNKGFLGIGKTFKRVYEDQKENS